MLGWLRPIGPVENQGSLTPDAQTEIDRLIHEGRPIEAIMAFRHHGSPTPSLAAGRYLLDVRYEALGLKPGSPSE